LLTYILILIVISTFKFHLEKMEAVRLQEKNTKLNKLKAEVFVAIIFAESSPKLDYRLETLYFVLREATRRIFMIYDLLGGTVAKWSKALLQ